jgi:hypothetical protein
MSRSFFPPMPLTSVIPLSVFNHIVNFIMPSYLIHFKTRFQPVAHSLELDASQLQFVFVLISKP